MNLWVPFQKFKELIKKRSTPGIEPRKSLKIDFRANALTTTPRGIAFLDRRICLLISKMIYTNVWICLCTEKSGEKSNKNWRKTRLKNISASPSCHIRHFELYSTYTGSIAQHNSSRGLRNTEKWFLELGRQVWQLKIGVQSTCLFILNRNHGQLQLGNF